jgi:hypothetical protein
MVTPDGAIVYQTYVGYNADTNSYASRFYALSRRFFNTRNRL